MVKVHDLAKYYPDPEKRAAILAKRQKDPMIIVDEDFPNDEEESWVWIKTKTSMKVQDIIVDEDFPNDESESWVWIKTKTSMKVQDSTTRRAHSGFCNALLHRFCNALL